jgi:hypothetical protein
VKKACLISWIKTPKPSSLSRRIEEILSGRVGTLNLLSFGVNLSWLFDRFLERELREISLK